MTDQESSIIQSLGRGLMALEIVAERPTTPKALAELFGVDRSTAYHIAERDLVGD